MTTGFAFEGDAEPGGGKHLEIVRSVADCHNLLGSHTFGRGDRPQDVSFGFAIDDPAGELASQDAAPHFEVVGERPVEIEFIPESVGEGSESTAHNADAVAERFQGANECPRAWRQNKVCPRPLDDLFGLAGQKPHPLPYRLFEVELTAHRSFGDAGDLRSNAGLIGEKINHLVLNQR